MKLAKAKQNSRSCKASKKLQAFIFISLYIVIFITGIVHYRTKLTYIERTNFNTVSDTFYEIKSDDVVLRQQFTAPYDMVSRVGIRIGTFARTNNSQWSISIVDPDENRTICNKVINASRIVDNSYHEVNFQNKNYPVRKGDVYELQIRSLNAVEDSGLAFYVSNTPVDGVSLYAGDEEIPNSLCLKLYGGDCDYWWIGFFIVIMIFAAVIMGLYFAGGANGLATFKENLVLQSMTVVFISFILLCTFSVNGSFSDENDNLRAGMEIANGAVLYRDYVTQHTPVPSYLCGLFAFLGAGSIAQMRLSFYLFMSVIWGLLYHRHAEFFGRRKMLLLPVLEAVFITSIVQAQGWMILADHLQGISMTALMLDFIRYLDDRKLTLGRCIVISACIWGSFGSAFVSAYALVFAALLFAIREIQTAAGHKVTFLSFVKRYYKLVLSVVIPLIIAAWYFHINGALRLAYRLTYKFNTDVYSDYVSGFGTKRIQPLINAFQSFFGLVADTIGAIIRAQATNTQVLQLIFVLTALAIIIRLFLQKKYYESLLWFFMMCGNATRGYNFHGLASWYVMLALVAVHFELVLPSLKKLRVPAIGAITVFMLSIYVGTVGNNLLTDATPVSDIETAAIEKTDAGDRILIDTYTCDSIYLLYKDRFPANRATYFLPWYMDWYEHATIDDLEYYKPKVVIYNPDLTVWTDYVHFTPAFLKTVQAEYDHVSDDPESGWTYYFWTRK